MSPAWERPSSIGPSWSGGELGPDSELGRTDSGPQPVAGALACGRCAKTVDLSSRSCWVSQNGFRDREAEAIADRVLAREGNLGFAGANNLGFAEARGEWLGTVNDDAVVDEGWSRRLLAAGGGSAGDRLGSRPQSGVRRAADRRRRGSGLEPLVAGGADRPRWSARGRATRDDGDLRRFGHGGPVSTLGARKRGRSEARSLRPSASSPTMRTSIWLAGCGREASARCWCQQRRRITPARPAARAFQGEISA